MEKKDPFSVDIKKVLLDMRRYRMGLIQTPDQLRFSYMAVIEGAKFIMGDSTIQVNVQLHVFEQQIATVVKNKFQIILKHVILWDLNN